MMKNKFLIFLIFLAIISGLIWGLVYERDPRPEFSGSGEAYTYDQTALRILEEGPFYRLETNGATTDRIFYPIFLSGVYGFFGHNYRAVTLTQVLLFVLIVILVYLISQMIFNEKIARLAGIMTALCYSIASFSGWVSREVFFTFLITLLIYLIYKSQFSLKNIRFILSGLIIGLAILTNSVIQAFALIIILNFFFLFRKGEIKRIYPKISLFFIALALVLSPWLIKGNLSFGGGGLEGLILRQRAEKMENLNIKGEYFKHLVGNLTNDFIADKIFSDYDPVKVRFGVETRRRYQEWNGEGKNQAEINQIFIEEAKEIIPQYPISFLKQTSIDFLKFNTPMTPDIRMNRLFYGTHPELSDSFKIIIVLLIRFIYLLFFITLIYGMFKVIKDWRKVSWIILVIFYFNLVFSLAIAIPRYSIPIYPFYIIFSAVGIIALWNKFKNKNENLFSDK